jgi:hypothetical protein
MLRMDDEKMNPHITEPMTMLTDYLLTAWSVLLAVSLLRKAGSKGRGHVSLWVAAFAVAAFAALAGGTAHGFKLYLGPFLHSVVWKTTVVSIGLTVLLMLIAGIRSAKYPRTKDREIRRRGHNWLKGGIAVSATGLLIQQSGWSLHEHFNHNDMYHLVQMLGITFFYRGVLLLHDL